MNRSRPKQIVIRLSDGEYQTLKTRVKQSGKNQQVYLLDAIFKSQIVNLDSLKALLPEMKKQGNNINQIARALNTRRENISMIEVEKTLKEVEETWRSLRQYLLART